MQIKKAILFIVGVIVSIWCCISPSNLEGVAFTSGESLNLENLTKLGTQNVNYFKDVLDSAVAIRYISHYDSKTMVFIGTYGMSYQQNIPLECMGVIFPIDSAYQRIDKNMFDFSAAVKTELEWLCTQKVIALSTKTITRIDSALSNSSNGGVQYWTHANTVLGYNSWYSYDTVKGNWGGVDGLKGVNGVYGCSLIKPDSGLPPQQLTGTGILGSGNGAEKNTNLGMAIRQQRSGEILVSLHRPSKYAAMLTILNSKGIVINRISVPKGSHRKICVPNTRLTPGLYFAEFVDNNSNIKTVFLVARH
jgi:hypothetical protein